jgi:hypothetical protein
VHACAAKRCTDHRVGAWGMYGLTNPNHELKISDAWQADDETETEAERELRIDLEVALERDEESLQWISSTDYP